MRNTIKKLQGFCYLFVMILFISGSSAKVFSQPIVTDYSGSWELIFYDASGKQVGGKTINVSEDGSISDKANMNLDKTIYLTEIAGKVSSKGKLVDGKLTDTDKLEMEGVFSGNFTGSEGSGTWKNYYNSGGSWKAKRASKDEK